MSLFIILCCFYLGHQIEDSTSVGHEELSGSARTKCDSARIFFKRKGKKK